MTTLIKQNHKVIIMFYMYIRYFISGATRSSRPNEGAEQLWPHKNCKDSEGGGHSTFVQVGVCGPDFRSAKCGSCELIIASEIGVL